MKSLKEFITDKHNKFKITLLSVEGDYDMLIESKSETKLLGSLYSMISANYDKIAVYFKQIGKYLPGSIVKPLSLILFEIVKNYLIHKKLSFKTLTVDAKKYEDDSFLVVIKFNETTISFLIEKDK